MLCQAYVEALLVDEQLADQVWELWHDGATDDETAYIAWMLIAQTKISLEVYPKPF
jgi:hypothetical protein